MRISKIAGTQAFLHVNGASHGFDRAWELRQDSVAGGVEDAAGAAGDEVVEYCSVRRQPAQRFLFVLGDELALTDDVGGQDGGDLAFHDPDRFVGTRGRDV